MKPVLVLAVLLLAIAAPPAAQAQLTSAVTTVERVDLDRYGGVWYEIARLPNRFQADCARDVMATYSRRSPTVINVVNSCRRADGEESRVEGIARIRDLNTNAKLEVRFAPLSLSWLPFVWDDYWILDVAPDYSHALVGEPSRDYLWILSRAPLLDTSIYERLVAKAAAQGYDTSKLKRTIQSAL